MSSDPNKKVKVLFACLDWRLHPRLENYFIQNNNVCDLCVTAGSVKGLLDPASQKYLLDQIAISQKLHNCQGIILTMHIDCGAYGGSKSFADLGEETKNYKNILQQAQTIVNANFPELPIETYIIGLKKSGTEWQVEPQKIF